jgi:hypothetical protein
VLLGEEPDTPIGFQVRVLDSVTSKPIEAAEVNVRAIVQPPEDVQEFIRQTGADGSFSFVLPRAGRYSIRVRAEGYWGYGERHLNLDRHLYNKIVRLDPRILTLEGRVLDHHSKGIAGASVSIGFGEGRNRSAVSARCDKDGYFFSDRIRRRGKHKVRASHREYYPSETLEVKIPGTSEVTLYMEPYPKDQLATIWGTLTDSDGELVPEAKIGLQVVTSASALWRQSISITDEEGIFQFRDIRFGTYLLEVIGQYRATSHAENETLPTSRATPITIDRAGEYRVDLELGGAQLRGIVVDYLENPVEDAFVTVKTEKGSGVAVETELDGSFEFPNLFPGRWILEATHRDYPRQEIPVDTNVQDFLKVVLPPGVILRGMLTDSKGTPIENFDLHLRRPGSDTSEKYARISAVDGRFQLRGVAPGTYLVRVAPREQSGMRGFPHDSEQYLEVGESTTVRMTVDPDLKGSPVQIAVIP